MEELKKLFVEHAATIIPLICTFLTTLISFLIYAINTAKKKYELKMEKLRLQELIIKGSYFLCPKCGEKVYVEDVEFYIEEKNHEKIQTKEKL